MTDDLPPVSCNLCPQQASSQIHEWSELASRATAAVAVPNGARVSLPLDLADAAADLAEREAACCAFLDIGVHVDRNDVVVEMTSVNPDAWPVITALTGVASP